MTKCPLCKETRYIRYIPIRTKSKILTYVGCSKCCFCKLIREEADMLKLEDLKGAKRKEYV
jgi:hypothetical protein